MFLGTLAVLAAVETSDAAARPGGAEEISDAAGGGGADGWAGGGTGGGVSVLLGALTPAACAAPGWPAGHGSGPNAGSSGRGA